MIRLFLRKAFYSGWDNLLVLLSFNVIIIAVSVGSLFILSLLPAIPILAFLLTLAIVLALGILFMTISFIMAKIADYKTFHLKDISLGFTDGWKHGIAYGLLAYAVGTIALVTIPFYFSLASLPGFALASLMFWVLVIFLLSFQWFLPIRSRLENNFLKALKKCFIIFFDNPGISLLLALHTLILILLSIIPIMMMPGISGIILAQNEAFRLLMLKYDWLEKQPEADFKKAKKNIPWDELLEDDDETVGHRSFRSFIFPWKD